MRSIVMATAEIDQPNLISPAALPTVVATQLSVGHLTQTNSLLYACLITYYRTTWKSYDEERRLSLLRKILTLQKSSTGMRLTPSKGVR
jgi:hypothetical protein